MIITIVLRHNKQVVNDPFGVILPGRSLTPQQRVQAQLLDQLWEAELEEFFDRLDLRPGARVLVYQCGLGNDLPRLARRVAPQGEVVGVQPDPFLAHEVRQNLREHKGKGIRVVLGDPAHDPIPEGLYEVIFVAWRDNYLQPWPPRARELLQRLRPLLSPQGRLAVWEDRSTGMRLYPRLPILERVMRRWQRSLPPRPPLSDTLAAEFTYCNIMLESARPLQKAEVPGSITGKWMDHWLSRVGPQWVESQLLSPRQWVRLQAQWEGRRVNPGTLYYSPQAMGVVGKALSSFVA